MYQIKLLLSFVTLFSQAAYEQTLEAKESALHVFKEIINDMIDRAPKLGVEHSANKVYCEFLYYALQKYGHLANRRS